MATISQTSEQQQKKGARFNPTPGRVRYSPGWLGLGAGVGALSLLALRRGGLPVAAVLGAAGLAGAAYAIGVEPRSPEFSYITLRTPNLPRELDGLRIGHLSDMHLGNPFAARNTAWAVHRVMAELPDLIALTGDFVSYPEPIPELPGLLRPLKAPLGVYAVPGNHDYWEGLDEIRDELMPLGIKFLINRGLPLCWNGAEFYLAGVDDQWDGRPDLGEALAGRTDGTFTLLLAHAPDIADEAASHGVDVQLSGHTHGGHLRLPLLGAFCLPRHGWNYPVGHEQVDALQVYISRGLGGLPLRMGCRPEATLITLRRG